MKRQVEGILYIGAAALVIVVSTVTQRFAVVVATVLLIIFGLNKFRGPSKRSSD